MTTFLWIIAGYFAGGLLWLALIAGWTWRNLGFARARVATKIVADRRGWTVGKTLAILVPTIILAWPMTVAFWIRQKRLAREKYRRS